MPRTYFKEPTILLNHVPVRSLVVMWRRCQRWDGNTIAVKDQVYTVVSLNTVTERLGIHFAPQQLYLYAGASVNEAMSHPKSITYTLFGHDTQFMRLVFIPLYSTNQWITCKGPK